MGNIFKPGHLCGVYGLDLYDHGMCGLISFQEEIWKGGIRIQVAFVPVDAFDFYWDFDLVFDQYADREAGADDCGAEFDGVGVAGVLLFQDEAKKAFRLGISVGFATTWLQAITFWFSTDILPLRGFTFYISATISASVFYRHFAFTWHYFSINM